MSVEFSWWQIAKNTLVFLLEFWPLWVILLVIVVVRLFFRWLDLELDGWNLRRRFRKGEAWRSDRDLLRWLRSMKPAEFEKYIADLFTRLGYKARAVGRSHDGGIDVVAEKDGVTNYIQCKKFITSQVTVHDVRDFYGALADHLANGQGYFITTNKFTLEARQFAEDKPISLVDGFELVRYIRLAKKDGGEDSRPPGRQEEAAEHASPTAPAAQACPRCGGSLVARTSKFGVFYGCSNYPKCRYTAPRREG